MINQNRNDSIDCLKGICAILVVLLHVPSTFQEYYMPLTRCAVPVFFIISGFFLYGNDTKQKAKRAIGKIGYILLWGSILYVLVSFIMNHCVISSIVPSYHDLFNFVFFNENPWAPHLWYLSAYIYVLFLILIIDKINLWELAFACIPFLLLVDLCFGKYSIVCWGREFNWLYIRNFLFVGLPYVLIGALVRKYERTANKISGFLTLGGVILFSLTSFVEREILIYYGMNAVREHYLSTTFLALSMFLTFLNFKSCNISTLSEIGRKDSLYIYVYHIMVASFMGIAIKHSHIPLLIQAYNIFAPIFVLAATIIFVRILSRFIVLRK